MTKTLVQSATIPTNTEKGSVCKIQVEAVKFADLWAAYPRGNPCDGKDAKGNLAFDDQCAIRVGTALKGVGVTFKSFPKAGKCWFEGHEDHILRAEQLADWLKLQPFAGCAKVATVTGADWQDKVKGKTGIVFFGNYWQRTIDDKGTKEKTPSGDHIDLWNGSRLTNVSFQGFTNNVMRFVIGVPSLWYSDLGKASKIWFWEIK
jgi:hypothetical protein